MSKLVIVESPTKAKTLKRFLGKDFMVMASYGHVRALPRRSGSVDIKNGFTPKYEILPEAKKHLNNIKEALRRVSILFLATDMDREGEAIAWHLVEALGLNNGGKTPKPEIKRIVFHEITQRAIMEALKNPREISKDLVDAQKARVILDYLVGFNLSPFLWKKVKGGLSAGRVQSVALRLICEREREIENFKSQEYWTIEAFFKKKACPERSEGNNATIFSAKIIKVEDKKLEKFSIKNEQEAQKILDKLKGSSYKVAVLTRKEIKKLPSAPFITSTIQQAAHNRLGFPAKKTMVIAQQLYEGIEMEKEMVGLITYMRTDSVHLSEEAEKEAKEVICQRFGPEYAQEKPRRFKNKPKNAQEAHEAIRPTSFHMPPEEIISFLTQDQSKLYQLIWQKALASQMATAILDSVTIDIAAADSILFRATGSTIKFPGFMVLYEEEEEDEEKKNEKLPYLEKGEELILVELKPIQHFTQPPPRYTEASLIKTLEEHGIGRPSTYASIMSTIQNRQYVNLEKKKFYAQPLGLLVNDLLVTHFPKYVDYNFTANMEEDLDNIAKGKEKWRPIIEEFWEPFYTLIQEKDKEIKRSDLILEKTDISCPKCNKPLAVRLGRYGKFYACTGYPDCKYTEPYKDREKDANALEIPCPLCKNGRLRERKTKKGISFYGCTSYPSCQFASWEKPLREKCPQCGSDILFEKTTKQGKILTCYQKDCGFKSSVIR